MTTTQSLISDLRIIEFIDSDNRPWYYVQKRFLFVFWLICVDREGFPSLEMARQSVHHYLVEQ